MQAIVAVSKNDTKKLKEVEKSIGIRKQSS
jgi:hypothetical protein